MAAFGGMELCIIANRAPKRAVDKTGDHDPPATASTRVECTCEKMCLFNIGLLWVLTVWTACYNLNATDIIWWMIGMPGLRFFLDASNVYDAKSQKYVLIFRRWMPLMLFWLLLLLAELMLVWSCRLVNSNRESFPSGVTMDAWITIFCQRNQYTAELIELTYKLVNMLAGYVIVVFMHRGCPCTHGCCCHPWNKENFFWNA